jgi:hypothetical protein
MRNLRNIQYTRWTERGDITSACWDPAKDELLCTVGPGTDGQIVLVRVSEPPYEYVYLNTKLLWTSISSLLLQEIPNSSHLVSRNSKSTCAIG